MPLPIPRISETQREYIERCYPEAVKEWDNTQALGVCYSRWREKKMRIIRDLKKKG
jgi:hypothetical protein